MEENITKRDELAKQRTHLSNEQTLLSFIRTALALLGLGILLMKYEPTQFTMVIGISSSVLSIVFLIYGIYKYKIYKTKINN